MLQKAAVVRFYFLKILFHSHSHSLFPAHIHKCYENTHILKHKRGYVRIKTLQVSLLCNQNNFQVNKKKKLSSFNGEMKTLIASSFALINIYSNRNFLFVT